MLVLTNLARYKELAQYHGIIQKANRKFRLKAVYDLDVQFRMSLLDTSKGPDQTDSTEVRAEGISCQHCKSNQYQVRHCSFHRKQMLESKALWKASMSAKSQWKFAPVPQQPRRMQLVPAKSMSTRKRP